MKTGTALALAGAAAVVGTIIVLNRKHPPASGPFKPAPNTSPVAAIPGRPAQGLPPPPGQRPVPEALADLRAAFLPVLYQWYDGEGWVVIDAGLQWRERDARQPGFLDDEIDSFQVFDFTNELDFEQAPPYRVALLWAMGYAGGELGFASVPIVVSDKDNYSEQ